MSILLGDTNVNGTVNAGRQLELWNSESGTTLAVRYISGLTVRPKLLEMNIESWTLCVQRCCFQPHAIVIPKIHNRFGHSVSPATCRGTIGKRGR